MSIFTEHYKDDLSMYYKHSVVLYEGEPCLVCGFDFTRGFERGIVIASFLETGKSLRLPLNGDFSVHPMRLGYVKVDMRYYYAYRIPYRGVKAGLNTRNLRILLDGVSNMFPERFLSGKSLRDTIKNKYPSLEEAISKIQAREYNVCAFDRQFAIQRGKGPKNFHLRYKDRPVGKVNGDSGKVVLKKEFSYLRKILEN